MEYKTVVTPNMVNIFLLKIMYFSTSGNLVGVGKIIHDVNNWMTRTKWDD